MRNSNKLMILGFLLSLGFSADATLTNQEKTQLFSQSNLKSKYVMIGDSITAQGFWSELLSTPIANRGIGGNTSEDILKRIDGIVKLKAQKAFILMGVNDLSKKKTADEVYDNYINLINKLRNANTIPVIQTTMKCNVAKLPRWKTLNGEVMRLNRMLKAYASTNGIEVVDLDASLTDSNGLLDQYSPDGMHLNLAGFKLWSSLVKSKL